MKKKRIWGVAAVLFLILAAIAFWGTGYAEGRTENVQVMDISTGDKNESLAYDVDSDILYVGTHSGILTAYKDEEILWTTKGDGAYQQLTLNETKDKLYAANENQHAYIFSTSAKAIC